MFVADRSGVGARQMFVDPSVGGHNHGQAWSPDGRWIYFARGIQATGQLDVWRIADSGGDAERLTYHDAFVGFPTPIDDRYVLYVAQDHDGSGPWLWALDTRSRATRRVAYGTEQYLSIGASADRRRLVASVDDRGPGLFTIPLDHSAPVRLIAGSGRDPVWSPSGDVIVYTGANVSVDAPLLAIRADGASVEMPAIRVRVEGDRYRFVPNGRALVCAQGPFPAQDFWLLDLATKKSRQLTRFKNSAATQSFDVTEDGKQIVFDRLRENSDIVLIDLAR